MMFLKKISLKAQDVSWNAPFKANMRAEHADW